MNTETRTREQMIDNLVEVELLRPDAFLIIRETLTRMGVADQPKKTLEQCCYLLHKKKRYYIVHSKELFALDSLQETMEKNDTLIRNGIIEKLISWGLIKVKDPSRLDNGPFQPITPFIIPHGKKAEWVLRSPYKIGFTGKK